MLLYKMKCAIVSWFAGDQYQLHGVIMPVDRGIMSNVVIASLVDSSFERPEAEFLKQSLRADDRVLELGGGLGLISTMASKLVPQGVVVTVEANLQIMNYLKRLHTLNAVKVESLNAVVVGRATTDQLPFYVRKDFWSSSLSDEPKNYTEVRSVNVIPLTSLTEKYRPTVVICDIEGGEVGLIDADWTEGIRLVMIEVHKSLIGQTGINQLKDYFAVKGFNVELTKRVSEKVSIPVIASGGAGKLKTF